MHNLSRCHHPRIIRNLPIVALAMAVSFSQPSIAIGAIGAITRSTATDATPASSVAQDLAQDTDTDDNTEVSPDQVEKYVAVYRDMQRDRGLTVETAAAKEGLTVSEFRALEQKVEHDEGALERARSELQAAQSPAATASAAPARN